MQIYLLAANLFALAALLLGWSNFSGGARTGRLLPLYLLVISRSLSLILAMALEPDSRFVPALAVLELFSTYCMVWALTGPLQALLPPWRLLSWGAAAAGLLLSLLPLLPFWPVPFQIHSLAIAVFGASLVFTSTGRVHWTHLAAPLTLALAAFINLVGFAGVSWLVSLLAYAFLISNIHWQSLNYYAFRLQVYRSRQQAAETLVQESLNLNRERQRLLGLSEMISAVPNLSQSMEHIVRSVARATRVDQAAIFTLDLQGASRARLMAVYSPARPVHLAYRTDVTLDLAGCPPLQKAVDGQRQLLLAEAGAGDLEMLYHLWEEERVGPTLIQPLIVQGRPVGALVLGNPVSCTAIRDSDARLCRILAPQIATMVEHRRRYLDLELQAETMAADLHKEAAALPLPTGQDWDGQAEECLEVLEIIGDGVVVSDTTGQVRLVNQAAERILGQPRRALIGRPINAIYGQIDAGEAIDDLLVAFSRRDQPLPTFVENEERAIQGRLIPWRNRNREWLGIVAVFRDVTREVKADQARNDFIAALSRELRAPLTAVKGYSELITQGAMGAYSPDQLRVQRIIQSNSDQMAAVLDNAIQLTSQNRYKLLPRFEEVDVVKIIDAALREISPLAQVRELRLSQEIKGQLPPVMADPRHLRRILDNLLANACHFTPAGGYVTVRAWLQSEREGKVVRPHLILAVADNGIGIPQIDLKRIFDPFYQAENQRITEKRGMGMGLAVVKELVELHQGRVWAESVSGEGSIFQVALPVTQE